ncbi:hypothetical protein ACFVHQ_22760 [Actinomycetes bacterium NPDC127524]|uniref:hypothetical protein n=1 Tax=Streptomyces niveus TaxID=193462 RepID=UPI003421D891
MALQWVAKGQRLKPALTARCHNAPKVDTEWCRPGAGRARANASAAFLRFGLAASRRQETPAVERPLSSLRSV